MKKETLDQLVRDILHKTEFSCFTCGKTQDLEVGHFVPRRYLATRWDLRNCHLQCIECNRFKNGNLKEYERRLGDLASELWIYARSTPKVSLGSIYNKLRGKL